MSVRVPVVLGSMLAAGCGLVSGLDSLGIADGSAPIAEAGADAVLDAPPDVTTQDAISPPDAAGDGGARAGTALQSKGSCATGSASALALSNDTFTITLWLRVDSAPLGLELDPILWKGGRSTSEPGWSLVLQGANLMFCVADTIASKCTTAYAIVPGDLVHVAVRSQVSLQARSVVLYARDVTAGDASHANVGSVSSAATTWTTNVPFVIGGAQSTTLCSGAPSFTVDDVRVYSTLLTVASLDTNESVDVSCSTNALVADYKFNEGSGSSAADCTSNGFNLTLGTNQKFIPSPFP